MSEIPLKIKHAGKTFEVNVDTNEPGIVLKSQLFSVTGVPPERQKILVKGGALKDDADLKTFKFKPNQMLMMIGTAGDLPAAPANQSAPEASSAAESREEKAPAHLPSGIINLGNTCYMNASLQALRGVPELQQALKEPGSRGLARALANFYNGLGANKSEAGYFPLAFLTALREQYPQFAEQDRHGGYKQQDAEELWSQVMYSLSNELADTEFVKRYFGGRFETELTCEETTEEPVQRGFEDFTKLACHITIKTNFLKQGLTFDETIERHSDVLGRDAAFKRTAKIVRLPKYLAINYVRFFWRRDTQKKSKILRKVAFPFILDMTDVCEESYAKQLAPARDKLHELSKDIEDHYIQAKKKKKLVLQDDAQDGTHISDEKFSSERLVEMQKELNATVAPSILADTGASKTGLYELFAVVSHQGPSADAGHYQCWRKNDDELDEWYKFNDDKVTIVDQATIEKLAGGGESDSALILLYREKELRG